MLSCRLSIHSFLSLTVVHFSPELWVKVSHFLYLSFRIWDKIRYSLLLKIHIQVIMLQGKNLQLFSYCLLYVCIIAIKWRLAFAFLVMINIKTFTIWRILLGFKSLQWVREYILWEIAIFFNLSIFLANQNSKASYPVFICNWFHGRCTLYSEVQGPSYHDTMKFERYFK